MAGWHTHEGNAVALPADGIDTDQLIPARFMSTPRAKGYGQFLLYDQRFDQDAKPIRSFPLNRHPSITVLVAGRNFGSGSSREAAVYALADYGIRAVLAPSFGDIFASNAVNNGVLPACVDEAASHALLETLGVSSLPVRIDVSSQTIRCNDMVHPFDIDPVWRTKLMEGWDDIDLTANHQTDIATFRETDIARRPWAQLSHSA